MFGMRKPKKPKKVSPGLGYIQAPLFNESNLGRYARPRDNGLPLVNFAGSDGFPVARSMEAFKPAIAYQGNTIVPSDPRGLAGNTPVPRTPATSPLIDLSNTDFSNPTPIG